MSQDHDPNDLEWALLTRYLTGELSPAEASAVERWFEADLRHRALLDELRAVWMATDGETTGWETERAISELRRRAFPAVERRPVAARGAMPRRQAAPSFTLARRWPSVAVAAGIAGVAVGGGALALHLVQRRAAPAVATDAVAPRTDVATRRGQRAEVRLADGSRVMLGPASRLSYANDFGRRDRTVTLEGDGYFDVVHDGTKPFRVRTAQGVAEDIGTAFVVRARARPLEVVVAEGAVVLRPTVVLGASQDSVVLTEGQLGRVLGGGRLDVAQSVKLDAYLAWTRGELVFEDTPLADVAVELSRWYDVDVQVGNPTLAARRFSGRFAHRGVEDAVRLVAAVTDVSVQRAGNGWVFQ